MRRVRIYIAAASLTVAVSAGVLAATGAAYMAAILTVWAGLLLWVSWAAR